MIWKPWTLFTVAVAGWMSQQQEVIAYLHEENEILWQKFGRKRMLLSIEQKRRLATKGKVIGRELLSEFGTLFSPRGYVEFKKTPCFPSKLQPKLCFRRF
ncbi:unnamed protein product [marine sediment metagenome]|uniref:Uncharacterized protein n=1 Tax=marine sediment metagenome TaxID=412755 RepID=X1KB83_9ZZZZ